MNGERKLSLVKPGAPRSADLAANDAARGIDLPEGEPPVTDEELREAEALRASLERGGDPLASALRAAVSPTPIEAGDLDAILARAMGDLDAPPTALEEREAERLRVALDEHDAQREGRLARVPVPRREAEGEPAALAIALRAAWAPSALSAARSDALVGRALAGAAGAGAGAGASESEAAGAAGEAVALHGVSAGGSSSGASSGASSSAKLAHPAPAARKAANDGNGADVPAPISLRRFRLGARAYATMTAVVAIAAGVLLLVGRLGQQGAPAPASVAQAPAASVAPAAERAARIAARSTEDLFDATTPFPRTGGESARVDRIASARAADLRANRFAAWGVR